MKNDSRLVKELTSEEVLIELQELLTGIRAAEIKLAEMQHEYIKFITEKVMQNVSTK